MKTHFTKKELHGGSSADFNNYFQHLCKIPYTIHIPVKLACTFSLFS